MLDTHARKYVQPALDKTANGFIKLGFSANGVTILAFAVGLMSCAALCLKWYWPSVAILWISGLFDAVDGTISRKMGTSSPLGALLDVVFDRIVEISILMALIFIQPELALYVAIVLGTIIVSMTIFLTFGAAVKTTPNDKADSKKSDKSFYYQAGVAERSEGFIMLSLAIVIFDYRHIVLLVFAGMILFTAVQRFIEAVKYLKTES
jgi:phosphatidylglycerophosphate synthase